MREIRNFIAHLKQHGISRNNRFRVTIPLPPLVDQALNPPGDQDAISDAIKNGFRVVSILNGDGIEARRGLQIMCSSTELPGVNIDTIDVKQGGPSFKIASGTSKSDIQFNFLISADCFEKNTLDLWRKVIFDSDTRKVAYYDDYKVDIQIEVLDVKDRVVYSINLEDAYPILLSPITLNKRAVDEMMQYRCTFTYAKVSEFTQSQGILSGSVIEEVLDDVQNGDWQSALATSREQILKVAQGNYTGVALEMHGMISETTKQIVGMNATDAKGVMSNFIPSIQTNPGISSGDKGSLTKLVKDLF
ncbi:baseplate tail tube protein [Vibrio phage VP-1]|uniref:Baseplate tail tube protein n=1 Tax=Vibrio phage VP-1 TaxID=2234088 RepID=A0A4P2THC6_9CAUD|nr:baseplate tail tube protein [Vibrio phage VP-1]